MLVGKFVIWKLMDAHDPSNKIENWKLEID
jgi:hypothetical protein